MHDLLEVSKQLGVNLMVIRWLIESQSLAITIDQRVGQHAQDKEDINLLYFMLLVGQGMAPN